MPRVKGRQHQVVEHVDRPGEALAVEAHVVHPREREQGDHGGEHYQQHDPRPEHRRRVADQRQHGNEVAEEPFRVARGEHSEEGAEDDRQHQRGHDQQDRRPEPGQDEIQHRRIEEQRVPEVPRQHALHVHRELVGKGLVQPVGAADVLDDLLGGAAHLARDGQRGVARCEADQEEVENDDRRDQRRGVEQAAYENDGEPHGGESEGEWIAQKSAEARRRYPSPVGQDLLARSSVCIIFTPAPSGSPPHLPSNS